MTVVAFTIVHGNSVSHILSPEEIEHTILLGVTAVGFSSMMTALSWARAAMDAHAENDL